MSLTEAITETMNNDENGDDDNEIWTQILIANAESLAWMNKRNIMIKHV